MTVYHGSMVIVEQPKVIASDVGRDFGPAFYTTGHTLIRATLVSAIVTILAAHWGVSPEEAMRRFYSSKTAVAFADDATGLYGLSALNIAGECVSELDGRAFAT